MENENIIVCKFGGSSVASRLGIKNIREIVANSPQRRIIVVSAPGKCKIYSEKVTDLLIKAHLEPKNFDFYLNQVKIKYLKLIRDCGITFNLDKQIKKIIRHYKIFKSRSFLLSRGEWLSAKIISIYLGIKFVDASKVIKFSHNGKILPITYSNIRKYLKKFGKIIIPGFYGASIFGKIKVMSRGGADITGSICQKAIKNSIYENFTDVNGIYTNKSNVGNEKQKINKISFNNIRFLSFFGSSVLHYKCTSISNGKVIIKNTFSPNASGSEVLDFGNSITASAEKRGLELEFDNFSPKIKYLLKNLKAEKLYFINVLGGCKIGICVFSGYTDMKILNKLQKYAKLVKNINIYAEINDKNAQNYSIIALDKQKFIKISYTGT